MNDILLSGEERARRQKAVDFARTNIELSGFGLTPEMETLNARFVSGDLSIDEFVSASIDHANTLPASEPVQEYFTSLEELEAARSAAHDRHA